MCICVRESLLNQVKTEPGGGLNTVCVQVGPRQRETKEKRSFSTNKVDIVEKKAERPARQSRAGKGESEGRARLSPDMEVWGGGFPE